MKINKKPLKKNLIFKILENIKKINLKSESILLESSIGRFLHEDIRSNINLPPFNNSAVDGYALTKEDVIKKNNKLLIKQRIAAGDKKPAKLNIGEVARIFTGAPMPKNSNTVVMQENTEVIDNYVFINKMPNYKENSRSLGEDICKGRKIFLNGDKVDSQNINLIAAIGKKKIKVKKKIKIGFYTSGNELKLPTQNLKESEINNSNYYSLNSLLDEKFIKSKYLGILKDNYGIIRKSLNKNSKKYDVIITTGGASVGEEDYLIDVLKKIGKIFFWKTAIKPGRPLAIGKIDETIIICLPGNPVSVHLLFGMIVKPFLKHLSTGKMDRPKSVKVKTNFSMKKKNKRLEWIRVKVKSKSNYIIANKYKKQGSGMISSIVFSDGILEIPENINFINKGDYFDYYSFDNLFK